MVPWNIIASEIEDNDQTERRRDQCACSIEIEIIQPCYLAKRRPGVMIFEADLSGKLGKLKSPVDKQDGEQAEWK